MKTIIVVGRDQTGKTTWIKNRLVANFRHVLVFDVNGDYNKNTQYTSPSEFLNKAIKARGHLIIFEESTIFFPNAGLLDERIRELIVTKGKNHRGNTLVFVYHSLRAIPVQLMDLANWLILFKTNDNEGLIRAKYKFNQPLLTAFNKIKEARNEHGFEFINLRAAL